MLQWFQSQKVKGQGHNAFITENELCHIIALPLQLTSWNFLKRLPISQGCTLLILRQKVKGQGHNALNTENDFFFA